MVGANATILPGPDRRSPRWPGSVVTRTRSGMVVAGNLAVVICRLEALWRTVRKGE
jgi:acetyltransferase-like isoleucine patch superfamily enzyme